MSDEAVLSALHGKRDDLERLIQSYEKKVESLKAHLSSMKGVLTYHEQDVPGSEFLPHMSIRRLFRRGEIQTYCLEALQDAKSVLSTPELTRHVMARKGLDVDDMVLRKKVVFSVMQSLKTARKRRLVIDAGKRRNLRLWTLFVAKQNGSADHKENKWMNLKV